MALSAIESALKNQVWCGVARYVLVGEWNRSAESPAQIYYEVIRDKLAATFQLLESSKLCSEWDSFRYCSNALLELGVKNAIIVREMELRVMHKLSVYGLRWLCGDPINLEHARVSWEDSIDLVVQWVKELRGRPKCYDFLDVDDEVMFRIRMIHNHLFFIKNQPVVRELPLKEIIFCLAIFVGGFGGIQGCEVYRTVINKRNVMQFLIAIASRLDAIINRRGCTKHRHASALKKLRKAYRRVKQMYSVLKIARYSDTFLELEASDYKKCNASLTMAALKRFNQICGETIKNTVDTPNLSAKLSNLLPKVLNNTFMLSSKYRNFSSHGFPLSHLFFREADKVNYYIYMKNSILLTAVSFRVILVYILNDCNRYTFGMMRRCRTIDDLRALIRYVGSSQIRLVQEGVFKVIEQYFSHLKNILRESPDALSQAQMEDHDRLRENYDQKMEMIKSLCDLHLNQRMDVVEVVAFSNASISAVYHLLDSKLAGDSSDSVFKTMFSDWKVERLKTHDITMIEFTGVISQRYILSGLEPYHDSTEQWRYRLKTQEILAHFTSDIDMDESTLTTLEKNLHSALSKTRNGYYQNIFALDSKSQAILQTLKPSITGPKSSKDFKTRNNRFKSQLEALRRQDEQELREVMQKIIQNLRKTFQRYKCATIDKFIENHMQIPIKARLAIEFWQLQTMEILYSSGYLGDNFCLLTKSIPMIWGKSYRNYLAHDSLSYDLLTSSDSIKTLINGFVLAFNSSELDIFTRPVKFTLDGLVELKEEGFRWLKTQSDLLQSILNFDRQLFKSSIDQNAEPVATYLRPLGKLLRPRYNDITEITSHERFDCESLVSPKINHAVPLNLLQIHNLPLHSAIQQIEILQPDLMTPIVGAVIPHLFSTNNVTFFQTLLDRYAAPADFEIFILTRENSEMERYVLATHSGLTACFFSELTDKELSRIFFEDHSVSYYELETSIMLNNLWLFKHIIQNCYRTSQAVIDESNILQSMKICCFQGRFQMVRCLLANGFVCDPHFLSDCLFQAISNRHWKIVDLLLKNRADAWLRDGLIAFSLVDKQNFRMVRKILEDGVPNHLAEKFIIRVARYGSKRLLKHLVDKKMHILECEDILLEAFMNENVKVLNFLESMIFEPVENASTYAEFRRWIKMLQDLRALMLLSIDSDFIRAIIPKTSIAEPWIDRISKLLKIDDDHFAKYFHFEDPSGQHCSGFPENDHQVNKSQFKTTLQKCTTLIDLIKSVPPGLFEERTMLCIEFRSPHCSKTIEAEIDLTIYSTIAPAKPSEHRTTILTEDIHHTANVIRIGLRTFLLKFQHLKAATATVSMCSKRFHYIQIDSTSCIVQHSAQESINLSYLLNKPGQRCVLHDLNPSSTPHLVESLLQLGANPALQDEKCHTPFHSVLFSPFPLELYQLMYLHYKKSCHYNHEIHVFNIKDVSGCTALYGAVSSNNYEVTEFLLQNGADPTLAAQAGDAAGLELAILNRNVRIVDLLLQHSPGLVKQLSSTKKGMIALEIAVKINHEHIVRLLLDCGADLNHRNFMNFTPLQWTIENESVESLQVMLDFAHREGVIIDDVTGCGTTLLQLARQDGACPEIIQSLVCHSIKSVALSLIKLRDQIL